MIKRVIACYQDVFADPPWNEWMKCPSCGEQWGKKHSQEVERLRALHCGVPMEPYYTVEQVGETINKVLALDAPFWIAKHGERVIGFCWGYPTSLDELEKNLGISIRESYQVMTGQSDGRIAYQSELGLVEEFRGQKIARRLVSSRLEDFLARGLEVGVVRTKGLPDPSVTYLWFTGKLGYQQVATYPDGRVVLARRLHDLPELLT